MLNAIVDPKHPNHAEAKEWLDDHDPNVIDEPPIKYALARIANRRNGTTPQEEKNRVNQLARRNHPPQPLPGAYDSSEPASISRLELRVC